MRIILHSRSFYVLGAAILIVMAIVLLVRAVKDDGKTIITATVERGDVTEIVSVSGVVEAENTAELAFPVSGVVKTLNVSEGDTVTAGTVLAALGTAQLQAERTDAVAALRRAQADKDELIAGPRDEARSVTDVTVANARANLEQVTREQAEKVDNAYRILLSSSLIARAVDPSEDATAPVVSGTYSCDTEGSYLIEPYNTRTTGKSFPFRYSGLEYGTTDVFFESPGQFGSCGLALQFTSGDDYGQSEWTIDIPNKKSGLYQSNLNAYELALEQQQNAVEVAENALRLAENQAFLENAAPRGEDIVRANAAILQAQARINAIDAQLADRTIVAPFDGVITDVSILPGETAGTASVITLLSADAFDLKARIPEIDITKVLEGQAAEVIFDARSQELLTGTVSFISPLATEIDGVGYFEATVSFTELPNWVRSGLNADIDIIVKRKREALRLPTRFVITDDDTNEVRVLVAGGEDAEEVPVTVVFTGNDGWVEISGVDEGTTVIAP